MNFGERCIDTAAFFNVRIPFQNRSVVVEGTSTKDYVG